MKYPKELLDLRDQLRTISKSITMLEKGESCCCGVTIAQGSAISEIGRNGNITLNELAHYLNLDKSTASRTVENLSNDGIILREIDKDDRRYTKIKLTQNGQKVFDEINDRVFAWLSKVFEDIDEEERTKVLEGLSILNKAMRKNKRCKCTNCNCGC